MNKNRQNRLAWYGVIRPFVTHLTCIRICLGFVMDTSVRTRPNWNRTTREALAFQQKKTSKSVQQVELRTSSFFWRPILPNLYVEVSILKWIFCLINKGCPDDESLIRFARIKCSRTLRCSNELKNIMELCMFDVIWFHWRLC